MPEAATKGATDRKRYVYTCRVIEPERRDVARAHQVEPVELHGAQVGELRQVAVTLTDEGAAAYRAASNLVPGEFEEVATATIQGVPDSPALLDNADAAAGESGALARIRASMAATRIPPDEDTAYGRSLWLRNGKQGRGIKVAVLDTDIGHAVYNILYNHLVAHRSWVGTNKNSRQDHGSHVACTALPENARLMHGAVLGEDGSGSSDHIIAGIHWAIDNGADIINLSLGGIGGQAMYERAIARARAAGILVICAAGNNAMSGNPVLYPAACDSAVSVAAYDRTNDRRAAFSTYNQYVDLAHSGVAVLSRAHDGGLLRMSGTSMACPNTVWVAAGLAAEYGVRGTALLKAMLSGARDTDAPITHEGHGVVNARAAARRLAARQERQEGGAKDAVTTWLRSEVSRVTRAIKENDNPRVRMIRRYLRGRLDNRKG